MFKLKSKLIITVMVMFGITVFMSCEKNGGNNQTISNSTDEKQVEILFLDKNNGIEIKKQEGNLSFIYKAKFKGNMVSSRVIFSVLNKGEIQSISFNAYPTDSIKKFLVFNDIEQKSISVRETLTLDRWIEIRNSFESFLKYLINDIDKELYKSELIQTAFFHLSIYNTIVRSFENEECNCTPIPEYFVNKSSFWCQEDFEFNTKKLLEYYEDNIDIVFSLEGGEDEYNYLKKINKTFVKYSELTELRFSTKEYRNFILNKDFNKLTKERDDCWLGIYGSDLGCCGNYSGCCWIASLACLRHDIACLECDHWHCGPACEPGI